MKSNYLEKINSLFENYEIMKKNFKWEGDYTKHLVSLTYTLEDKTIVSKELKGIWDYLKKETSTFSPFKGVTMLSICGLVGSSNDLPLTQIDYMINHLETIKRAGFRNSMYLPTALYSMSTAYKGSDEEGFLEKAMTIYKEMKSNHPFLTSGDDYALAVLLASTNQNIDLLEVYYKGLSEIGFTKSNGLQMLSQIMSLTNSTPLHK